MLRSKTPIDIPGYQPKTSDFARKDGSVHSAQIQGGRPYQEDSIAYSAMSSDFMQLNREEQVFIINETLTKIQRVHCKDHIFQGATFCAIFPLFNAETNTLDIIVAGIGDSRAYIAWGDEGDPISTEMLNNLHTLENEKHRLNAEYGRIYLGTALYGVSMARALGDKFLTGFGLSHKPDISVYSYTLPRNALLPRTLLIVASDGIELKQVVDGCHEDITDQFIREAIRHSNQDDNIAHEIIKKAYQQSPAVYGVNDIADNSSVVVSHAFQSESIMVSDAHVKQGVVHTISKDIASAFYVTLNKNVETHINNLPSQAVTFEHFEQMNNDATPPFTRSKENLIHRLIERVTSDPECNIDDAIANFIADSAPWISRTKIDYDFAMSRHHNDKRYSDTYLLQNFHDEIRGKVIRRLGILEETQTLKVTISGLYTETKTGPDSDYSDEEDEYPTDPFSPVYTNH